MPNSYADTDELVARGIRELLKEHEEGERLNVAVKARELGVHKDRLHRRLKGVGPYTGRIAANRKLSAVQKASLMRYILSLDEIGLSIPSVGKQGSQMPQLALSISTRGSKMSTNTCFKRI
jgi:hypothetical protein